MKFYWEIQNYNLVTNSKKVSCFSYRVLVQVEIIIQKKIKLQNSNENFTKIFKEDKH